jgi:hypothetical protein
MSMTTITASESARRKFIDKFLPLLNEATISNTDIEMDIYFVIEMLVETAVIEFVFDTIRGFYDQTMDAIEIADALLVE